MALSVIGIDFYSAKPEVRARFHLSAKQIDYLYQWMHEPMIILSTCNRTEIYSDCPQQDPEVFLGDLLRRIFPGQRITFDDFYFYQDCAAVRHLLELATGLRSMLLGETEIKGQIEKAVQTACERVGDLRELGQIFRSALGFAKEIRNRSKLGEHSTSLTSLVVKAIEQFTGSMSGRCIAVLGQGEIASKLARALTYHGCSLQIVTRRLDNRNVQGANYLSWDHLEQALVDAEIVIAATSAPHTLIHEEHARVLQGKLLIDLAFPRNIETSLVEKAHCTLWDLEHFKQLSEANLGKKRSAAKVAEIMCYDAALGVWAKVQSSHGAELVVNVG